MNKITTRLNIKNIQEMYDIQAITDNGQINLKDRSIIVYKIDPANIVACDEETKQKIYQAYLTCIRGLPDAFQVIISKDSVDFASQIEEYKRRINEIENEKLKLAIQRYIQYLDDISNEKKLYRTNHYLIVENMKRDEACGITNIFSNLEEFGVRISRVTSKGQLEKILKRYILKE